MVLSFDVVALIRPTGRPRGGEIWPHLLLLGAGSDEHVPPGDGMPALTRRPADHVQPRQPSLLETARRLSQSLKRDE